MGTVKISEMEKLEVAQGSGRSAAAIRAVAPEPSGKYWAVSEVDTGDASKCLCFRKVIAWATVLESDYQAFVTEARPLVYEEEGGWLELTGDQVVELKEIPENAEIQIPDMLKGCPVSLAPSQFYMTWMPDSE
ncbi:hypothetical protein J9D08_004157 [Salmonella enterica]|nr:hypothetical protein [Salmonella enterica]